MAHFNSLLVDLPFSKNGDSPVRKLSMFSANPVRTRLEYLRGFLGDADGTWRIGPSNMDPDPNGIETKKFWYLLTLAVVEYWFIGIVYYNYWNQEMNNFPIHPIYSTTCTLEILTNSWVDCRDWDGQNQKLMDVTYIYPSNTLVIWWLNYRKDGFEMT